jgi:Asp-tRNA(Asn)/Glu-tRNA(Gln) amidotransferase A subunit family amidase
MRWTIGEAAAALRNKDATPVDLVRHCLAEIDRQEGAIQAWALVDAARAMVDAERLTQELAAGRDRGPLHGIPLGVKDIFDVADWPTAAGSRLWADAIARDDATVVARLRSAGAIFLGKTVTTAFAGFDPSVTRNPHNLERTPGGSSSGSAAAVAAGMCLGAIGSQTGGSIIRPASYCGIAGCKPTHGLLPTTGMVPFAHSLDHPGPMASCVADLRVLLQALAGPASRGASLQADWPIRLGRVRGMFERLAEPAMLEAMENVVERLRASGIIVEDITLPAAFDEVLARHRTVMFAEAAAWHRERFARHPDDYPPRVREAIETGNTCAAEDYIAAKKHQLELSNEMDEWLEFGETSFLLTPATTGPAPGLETTGNPAFNAPWSYVGLPAVSFPMGPMEDGMPLAVQLVGPRFAERDLLNVAERCERVVMGTATEGGPTR